MFQHFFFLLVQAIIYSTLFVFSLFCLDVFLDYFRITILRSVFNRVSSCVFRCTAALVVVSCIYIFKGLFLLTKVLKRLRMPLFRETRYRKPIDMFPDIVIAFVFVVFSILGVILEIRSFLRRIFRGQLSQSSHKRSNQSEDFGDSEDRILMKHIH